ncbi:copper resistance CopC family protein [Demequina sediminicola]|uniref:copper resistance CopC family protein n=1 Tax=Demequina sediminicola TaxID=1095026 RepID=UPI000784C923|nr:copper resistance CopC family protein [Demequina sediminicola]
MVITRVASLRAVGALVLAALATALVAPSASAHTELRSSTPAADSTVEVLDEVVLEFSSDILDIGTELSLVDAEGTSHALEATYPSTNSVSAPVPGNLTAGAVTLQWRIVAEDGHPIEGTIPFTYSPADAAMTEAEASPTAGGASASPEPTASAVTTGGLIAEASPSPSPSASPAASDEEGGIQAWVWIVVAIAVIGTAGAALIAQSRRK